MGIWESFLGDISHKNYFNCCNLFKNWKTRGNECLCPGCAVLCTQVWSGTSKSSSFGKQYLFQLQPCLFWVFLNKTLCGKGLNCGSLQPDSWIPGGTGINNISLDEQSSITESHKGLGLQSSVLTPCCCMKGWALHPPPSASPPALLLASRGTAWPASLLQCLPQAFRRCLCRSLCRAPSESPTLFGKKQRAPTVRAFPWILGIL